MERKSYASKPIPKTDDSFGVLDNWTGGSLPNRINDWGWEGSKYGKKFNQTVGDDEVGAYRNGLQANAWIDKRYNYFPKEGGVEPYDFTATAGAYNPINPTYYASLALPINKELEFNKSYNTPLGQLDVSNNDTPFSVLAEFTPKNYYLQALARRIMGTDEQNL